MHLVKEVLRLTAAGLSQRQIARSLHLRHGAVGKYQAAAQLKGESLRKRQKQNAKELDAERKQ